MCSKRAGIVGWIAIVIILMLSTLEAGAQGPAPAANALGWIDVRTAGAKGNGIADDTGAIRRAITRAARDGVVYFPPGRYRVTDELVINERISIIGAGHGSQLFQAADKRLLVIDKVRGVLLRDLYLGSAATAPRTSLLALVHAHHARVENLTMLGADLGIHLEGTLLATFVVLKSGSNIRDFFGKTSENRIWVMGERSGSCDSAGYSANANSLIAPALEGGGQGVRIVDGCSEGSINVVGGSIEGVAGVGIELEGIRLPSLIAGVHLEKNGSADIVLTDSYATRVDAVYATKGIEIRGVTMNVSVTNSLVERVSVADTAVRTRLEGLVVDLSGTQGVAAIDCRGDTRCDHVSPVIAQPWFGTMGIGTRNPSANPDGLTPDRRVDIVGGLRATELRTPSLVIESLAGAPSLAVDSDGRLRAGTAGQSQPIAMTDSVHELADRLAAQEADLARLREELVRLRAER